MNNKTLNKCDVLLIGFEEFENLGLRSIAAFLDQKGVSVSIYPFDKSQKENTLKRIRMLDPKIVGFSLIFQRMLDNFAEIIAYLRQNGIVAHFTMGGHFPTVDYERILNAVPGLDSIIRCEGEQTLLELSQEIEEPGFWPQITGLAYRRNGKIMVTPPRSLIANLDELPFPLRRNTDATHRGIGCCSIISSRGCYFDCSFCSISRFYEESIGPKRRSRSPSNVVKEMEQLFRERGTRIFIFEDDDFAMKSSKQKQWIEDFIKEIKKSNILENIIWRISCRVDDVDGELLRKMMEVGLASVYLGIESGNNQGLKTYNKHYSVEDVYKTLDILHSLGIHFEFGFMMLNPESTIETVKEDIIFLKQMNELGEAVVHFTKTVPYAGTPIATKLGSEGRLYGTLASPDYGYKDSKLELLQLFLTEAFHFRNFHKNGLVERLRYAKFDSIVLKKFFSDVYDTQTYNQSIRHLIQECNATCLENLSLSVRFMEKQTNDEILRNWRFLDELVEHEVSAERQITTSLNSLMEHFS